MPLRPKENSMNTSKQGSKQGSDMIVDLRKTGETLTEFLHRELSGLTPEELAKVKIRVLPKTETRKA